MLRKRWGTSTLPECPQSSYIYPLAYANPYGAYMGRCGYGLPGGYQYLPAPRQVDWLTAQFVSEGLTALLETMLSEMHPLVVDLISLVHHNTRECLGGGIYAHEFYLLPIPQPQNFVYQC